MNFIAAIQHATIGYGIRRKAWKHDVILMLHNGSELHWLKDRNGVSVENFGTWTQCHVLGSDKTHDLTAEDIAAQDWEAI
jgi:hypothetical protein